MLINDEVRKLKRLLTREGDVREQICLEDEILFLKELIPELDEIFVEVVKI